VSPLKIIILGPTPPPHGGVAIYVSTLFRALRGRGVRLWTYSSERTGEAGITYLKPFRLKLIFKLIRELCKARLIDSSYLAIEHPHKLILPLWIAGKVVLKFEWIKIFHDGSFPTRYPTFTALEKRLVGAAVRSIDQFIVVNEPLRDWLRDELGVTRKISVISSLLPLTPDALDANGNQAAAEAAGRNAKRVCSIGVFIPVYGFKEVAEAVAQLRNESGEDIELVLIDCGYVSNPGYEREVVTDRDWITTLVDAPRAKVLQVLRHCDVFVRAFGLESYGLSRVEAIWCGVPVVATRAGETRGMLLYDCGDQDALIDQIKIALNDSTDRRGEIEYWSTVFAKEAQQNLNALISAIGLERAE
jgi:glycogen(starch) synthase